MCWMRKNEITRLEQQDIMETLDCTVNGLVQVGTVCYHQQVQEFLSNMLAILIAERLPLDI